MGVQTVRSRLSDEVEPKLKSRNLVDHRLLGRDLRIAVVVTDILFCTRTLTMTRYCDFVGAQILHWPVLILEDCEAPKL
jgi:hypothetical protein